MLEKEGKILIKKNCSYNEFDRLLDEIIKAEEDLTNEIRFFTQRVVDTEARIHKSIEELIQIINDRDDKQTAI